MGFFTVRRLRFGLSLLASGLVPAAGAMAQNQAQYPPGAVVQPLDTGPGAELRRNLTTLADNPRSVAALNGAGQAAEDMGDPDAALSFFTRANDADPQSGRAKAGMAAALVQLERAREAMPLFAEAVALGIPEAEIAADRGLAYDTIGDPRRAQADYMLALRREENAEVRRRLALSLAISGQREAALHTIDAQLRNSDRAAWRAQAFILALTGDAAGADRTAERVMPAGGAQAMAPFFARLAGLSPSQKALAVHFGHFPSDGRATASADVDTRADSGALAMAEGHVPPPAARPRPAEPVVERRRPDAAPGVRERDPLGRRASRDPEFAGPVAPPVRRPVETASAEPPPQPQPKPPEPAASVADTGIAPGFSIAPQGPPPAAPARNVDFGRIAEVVATLPADEAPRTRDARPARIAAATQSQSRTPARIRPPPPPPNPARDWVQIATGANRSGLPTTLAHLREEAGTLLNNRVAYTARATTTNRLLIGPFDSGRAAQALVNQLRARHIEAVAWTSEAGQEIDRLQVAGDTRTTRGRAGPDERSTANARTARNRSEPERSTTSRTSSRTRSEPERGTSSRASRGRSEPEPRTPARGRRAH